MYTDNELFKIETNHETPAQGKVLISEPFLRDRIFGRSVILLVDHSHKGTMGLVMNKPLFLHLNDVLTKIECRETIPLYKGGPIRTDTLFYIHTLDHIAESLTISKGLYLNGDFEAIQQYMAEGNPVNEKIRFFLGYTGWDSDQLDQELQNNIWLVGKETTSSLMDEPNSNMLWKNALSHLGGKYGLWSRFPQNPTLN